MQLTWFNVTNPKNGKTIKVLSSSKLAASKVVLGNLPANQRGQFLLVEEAPTPKLATVGKFNIGDIWPGV